MPSAPTPDQSDILIVSPDVYRRLVSELPTSNSMPSIPWAGTVASYYGIQVHVSPHLPSGTCYRMTGGNGLMKSLLPTDSVSEVLLGLINNDPAENPFFDVKIIREDPLRGQWNAYDADDNLITRLTTAGMQELVLDNTGIRVERAHVEMDDC